MGRSPRITEPGLAYHVLNRRVMRLPLFLIDEDHLAFERAAAESLARPDAPRLLAWCSFSKHYGRAKQAVVDYLARYAFRIAITNTRIVAMDDTHVTFKYKQRETG